MAPRGSEIYAEQTAVAEPREQSLQAELHARSVRLSFPEVVRDLVDIVGKKLTAYMASVKDVRSVEKWMAGAEPYKGSDQRLRTAYLTASLLATREAPAVIQRWFVGLNPELEDRSAATLLREGEIEVAGPAVLRAARTFIAGE